MKTAPLSTAADHISAIIFEAQRDALALARSRLLEAIADVDDRIANLAGTAVTTARPRPQIEEKSPERRQKRKYTRRQKVAELPAPPTHTAPAESPEKKPQAKTPPAKEQRRMSPAARAKISEAMRRRWAKKQGAAENIPATPSPEPDHQPDTQVPALSKPPAFAQSTCKVSAIEFAAILDERVPAPGNNSAPVTRPRFYKDDTMPINTHRIGGMGERPPMPERFGPPDPDADLDANGGEPSGRTFHADRSTVAVGSTD